MIYFGIKSENYYDWSRGEDVAGFETITEESGKKLDLDSFTSCLAGGVVEALPLEITW